MNSVKLRWIRYDTINVFVRPPSVKGYLKSYSLLGKIPLCS